MLNRFITISCSRTPRPPPALASHVCTKHRSRWLAHETGFIKPLGLAGHTTSVRAIAVGPDGRVYSGASDDTTRVWSSEDGAHLYTLEGHTLPVRSVVVTADGVVFTGSADQTIRTFSLWDQYLGLFSCRKVGSCQSRGGCCALLLDTLMIRVEVVFEFEPAKSSPTLHFLAN